MLTIDLSPALAADQNKLLDLIAEIRACVVSPKRLFFHIGEHHAAAEDPFPGMPTEQGGIRYPLDLDNDWHLEVYQDLTCAHRGRVLRLVLIHRHHPDKPHNTALAAYLAARYNGRVLGPGRVLDPNAMFARDSCPVA